MRVASNTVSDTIVRQIDRLNSLQASLQTQVSTGQRITNPEDDPAAIASAIDIESQLHEVQQFGQNATQALTLAQTSYTGLQGLKSISDRAGQLATLGTGTLGASAMSAYGTETNQLIEQAVQTANTNFSGSYIYGGTAVSAPPFSVTRDANGQISGVSYVGNQSQAAIPLSNSTSITPSTDGPTNSGMADFINNLVALRDALNSGDTSAVTSTQAGLSTSEDTIVSAIGINGGMQTRIEAAQTQQKSSTTNLQSVLSSKVDADLPSTVVKLSQAQTAYQAALQSAVNVMQLSILNYLK
jgi:flagellar hook-associated protein 3 FlgL